MYPILREKLYRDSVHDLIVFDANAREDRVLMALIDTPEFQRLRRIRQLGLAFTAFQGAEHSRFVHSIGVLWLTTRVLDRFQRAYGLDPAHVFMTRCAALLHDVGHGPFSHVLEQLVPKHHEERTREIVASNDSEINHVLSGYDLALPPAVMSILDHTVQPPFLADLIGSQLDTDRLDYLTRDSLMTGVKHGVFDLERLIYTLRLDDAGQRVVVTDKGIRPVEKYLQSRYHMFRQVYQHKTVKAAEAMLVSLLRRAMDLRAGGDAVAQPAGGPFDRFLLRRGDVELRDFLDLDDAALQYHWRLWSEHDDPVLNDLAGRLLRRRLFKSVEVDPAAPGFDDRETEARALLDRHGFPPEYYLLRLESSDIPYRPFEEGAARRHGPILVDGERPGAPLRDILDVSRVAAGLAQERYTQTRLAFPEERGRVDLRAEMIRIFQNS